MKRFRLLIVFFLIGLTIFYNIERLDFGEENVIDIDSAVYVLGFLATVSTIAIPLARYFNTAGLMSWWGAVFILSKLGLFYIANGRPLLGGIYTYLSITELALLLIVVWAVYKLTTALYDFELAVEKITFREQNGRVRQLDKANEDIQVEMFRSRYNHHPLSVIVVEPDAGTVETSVHRAVQEIQQAMIKDYVLNSMAHMVSKYLRRTDMVLEQRNRGRFMIFCPETTPQDTELLIEYIQTITTERMGIYVNCGAATFPHDAVTFEELVTRAEARIGRLGEIPASETILPKEN